MSPQRALLWFRRTLLWLGAAVVAYAIAWVAGWPSLWVGPVFAFGCAEMTRRICAESNPRVSLRWRDIFRVMRDPAGAPLEAEKLRQESRE